MKKIVVVVAMLIALVSTSSAQPDIKKVGVIVTNFDGTADLASDLVLGQVAINKSLVTNPLGRVLTRQEFDQLYSGDKAMLAKVMPVGGLEFITIIRVNCGYRTSSEYGDLVTADLGISAKTWHRSGRLMQSDADMQHGAGFNNMVSLKAAVERAKPWLTKLFKELH